MNPFCHKISSSCMVSGSACFFLVPFLVACRRFISASSERWKSANSGSLKKSIVGWPFHRKWRIMPQQMWCRLSGVNSEPSFLRNSRMKYESHCCNSVGCSSVSCGMETAKLLCLCWHHSSHSLTQYWVSCCVFLGTADTLASTISCWVFGAAKSLLLLVAAGVGVGLVSGHGGSYLLMTGHGYCRSYDSMVAMRMRSISLW